MQNKKKIKEYTILQTLRQNQHSSCYKVSKDEIIYFLKQFDEMSSKDEFSFEIRQKYKRPQILPFLDSFKQNQKQYFVSQYIPQTLAHYILQKQDKKLNICEASMHYTRILDISEYFHQKKMLLRDFNPQKILIKDGNIKLYDFSQTVLLKRVVKLYQMKKISRFISPDYYSQQGYSFASDIWAGGVLYYYMLTGKYPFNIKSLNENKLKTEFQNKCIDGFDFQTNITNQFIQDERLQSKNLKRLFKQIFDIDQENRIQIRQIRRSQPISSYVLNKQLFILLQQKKESSFISVKNKEQMRYYDNIKIYEGVIDFTIINQQDIVQQVSIWLNNYKIQFQKYLFLFGISKCFELITIISGKNIPSFVKNENNWVKYIEQKEIKSKIQETNNKINHFLDHYSKISTNQLKKQQLPHNFSQIKLQLRQIFGIVYKNIKKQLLTNNSKNNQQKRRLFQTMIRILILYLANNLFQSYESVCDNFKQYFNWQDQHDLSNLDEWIKNQKTSVLNTFMINIVQKYLTYSN